MDLFSFYSITYIRMLCSCYEMILLFDGILYFCILVSSFISVCGDVTIPEFQLVGGFGPYLFKAESVGIDRCGPFQMVDDRSFSPN